MRKLSDKMIEKINTSMQTPANNADPKMSIRVSRAKTTIMDSDYWTVETIRSKSGLGDVSVAPRRFKPYGSPNRIYEIHVDNGVVGTAVREYPDTFKGGWKSQFTLGPGSSVSVAFDGHWEKYRDLWRLITTEKPWISWVDSTGVLWTQLWDDESTRMHLASDVTFVRMIRAWKNQVIQQNDQGVVVAYIKTDGKVYYSNFCIQEDGTEIWENEKELTDFVGTAANVNLFITNDYRMGFVIEDSIGQIHWLVTPRNWGGMASPSDHVTTGITDITFEITPIVFHDTLENEYLDASISDLFFNVAEPIYPESLEASNDDEYVIRLLFNYEIDADLSAVKAAFKIKDSINSEFVIVTTNAGDSNAELVFNMANINAASGELSIIYDRTVMELDCLNQGSRFAIEAFTLNFIPELIPPDGFENEHLTAGIADLTFAATQVYYTEGFMTEHATANIVDTTFVVTKVGENPL